MKNISYLLKITSLAGLAIIFSILFITIFTKFLKGKLTGKSIIFIGEKKFYMDDFFNYIWKVVKKEKIKAFFSRLCFFLVFFSIFTVKNVLFLIHLLEISNLDFVEIQNNYEKNSYYDFEYFFIIITLFISYFSTFIFLIGTTIIFYINFIKKIDQKKFRSMFNDFQKFIYDYNFEIINENFAIEEFKFYQNQDIDSKFLKKNLIIVNDIFLAFKKNKWFLNSDKAFFFYYALKKISIISIYLLQKNQFDFKKLVNESIFEKSDLILRKFANQIFQEILILGLQKSL